MAMFLDCVKLAKRYSTMQYLNVHPLRYVAYIMLLPNYILQVHLSGMRPVCNCACNPFI